ncbi:MAG: FAD-dependent oxidoreductase [Nevskia sp.]|nr:FAD-dependent oxidoreductase [Nevskia sp.]
MKRRSGGRRRFLQGALGLFSGGAAAAGLPRFPERGGSLESDSGPGLLERLFPGPGYSGGFVGQQFDRGHLLRDLQGFPAPAETRRTSVAIVGGGIAGLAAARALQRAGIDDYRIFELEDEPGGNSRGGEVAGFACPWGAHYLPAPGPYAGEVAELLDEYRLRRVTQGRVEYEELHLCHSPQERLYIAGGWQEGLLPLRGQDAATLAEYRRFAELVRAATRPQAFTIPTAACRWDEALAALDAQSFAAWLDQQGLRRPALRWYLDYCCRDDYGAGLAGVSAWAGLHYFASRHGFDAPGEEGEREELLTWPEGNAWLARRLAAPHRDRTLNGCLALRVEESKDQVYIDVLELPARRLVRWAAQRAIQAVPLFVAARLLADPPAALVEAARRQPHAPWLVANLHIDQPLAEYRGNAPLSWDNVLYSSRALGYVDAMHQSTLPYADATVLTWYTALGDDPGGGRRALLQRSWKDWCELILADLSAAHPDLRRKLRQVGIMRYGHAMAIPAPGVRGSAWLAALRQPQGRVAFAHSDLSAYSVFEEALHWGLAAGDGTARALHRSSA